MRREAVGRSTGGRARTARPNLMPGAGAIVNTEQEGSMIHKGEEMEKKAERLEREANNTLDPTRRKQLRDLAADLRNQIRKWEKRKG